MNNFEWTVPLKTGLRKMLKISLFKLVFVSQNDIFQIRFFHKK